MAQFPNTPDRVAVLDAQFKQVFPNARPVSVRVSERSQLFDHTIETGQILTDYAIILPIEIEVAMIVEAPYYRDTYQQIRVQYLNKNLLTVQTNATNYTNMVLVDMPHDEQTEIYDALPIRLHFRQAQLVPDPSTYAPSDPNSTGTQALGQQNGYTISGVQTVNGTETIPAGTTEFSSVPPLSASTANPINIGPQGISIPSTQGMPVIGVQTITSQQSIQSVVQ